MLKSPRTEAIVKWTENVLLSKYLDASGYGTLSVWMVSFTTSYSFKKNIFMDILHKQWIGHFFCGICGNLVVTTEGNNAYDPNGQG